MAEVNTKFSDIRAGIDAEEWLKMWENGFKHNHSHVPDDDGHSLSSNNHSHGHHGHPTESEVDDKGNQLLVDQYLKNHLNHLTDGKPNKKILVSLCGSSPDMEWLSCKGYDVVGVELSEIAVKSAFEKSDIKSATPIPFEVSLDGNLKVFTATDGKKLKVYVANFFDDELTPEKIGTFDYIWDSHGIVSLPVQQQEPYAKKLVSFLKPGGKMLFSTVHVDLTKLKSGPAPAPVSSSALQRFYPERNILHLDTSPMKFREEEGWTNEVFLIS